MVGKEMQEDIAAKAAMSSFDFRFECVIAGLTGRRRYGARSSA
jgi:hypothetical protein